MARGTLIILLRGINVGGKAKLPMPQLREIAAGIGLADVQTYIQSGNLVATTSLAPATVAKRLRAAIDDADRARRADHRPHGRSSGAGVIDANPFPDASVDRHDVARHLPRWCGARRTRRLRRRGVRAGGVRRRRLGALPPPPRRHRDGRSSPSNCTVFREPRRARLATGTRSSNWRNSPAPAVT